MSELSLQGRTALVTGGGRGIGRACCERLAADGAKVAINYRTNAAAARQTEQIIQDGGGTVCVVAGDVSSADQVNSMVAEVTEKLGAIDLLVNNAGIFDYAGYAETTPQLWQRTLDVNLTGTYLVTWAVLEGMVERKFGRIVNIASIAGLRARPMSIAYAVSKAGVIALTKSLSEAVAGHNVRVNAVAPGLIDTEILDDVSHSALEKLVQNTPIPRMGEPSEIANLVTFLLGEQSSFTTGQTLVASGGRVLLP